MNNEEKIEWIKGTPLAISVREVESVAPHSHEEMIEIILCVSGSITVSYIFEEFHLKPGDFVLVDKDTHYLYDGKDCICASFYVDLNYFKPKYPYICSLFFVCEGTPESVVPWNTYYHKYLKSTLLALLQYVGSTNIAGVEYKRNLCNVSEKIIDLLVQHFDIAFWYAPDMDIKEEMMERYRQMTHFIYEHHREKVTIEDMSREFGLSKAYISEFFSQVSIGFRTQLGFIRACSSEKYLIKTDMNIVDISEVCGFSDPKYYYTTFKLWYNCTPNQFRKKYIKEMQIDNKGKMLDITQIAAPLQSMMKSHIVDMFIM